MPEHFRALIVILFFAATVFAVARKSACAITTADNFTRRRNLWFVLTIAAFFSYNFWLFIALATAILIYAKRREPNPPALYFFILFILPIAPVLVPGMGLVNFLFLLTYPRVLALVLLLPASLYLRRQSDTLPFGRTGPDKAIAGYLLLTTALFLREDTLTNCLRQAFYLFVDAFLPYYVASRSLKTMPAFRDALLSLVLAIMVLAPIAVFENLKHWLLYTGVSKALGMTGDMTGYLGRDGMLRAVATAGQAIALGYLMVVGTGFYLFLQRSIQQQFIRRLGLALLVVGLIAPLSRGPWVGALALFSIFIITGRKPFFRLMAFSLGAVLALLLISALPGGERAINLLPFIGTTETGNIDYRDRLLTNSMIVIQRSPWFGSTTYLDTPEMQEMMQGQGIIDVVNTYIGIALESGFAGLGLFIAFFVLTLLSIYRATSSIGDKDSEEYLLGRTLLATLLAILVIIFTVSSITFIPIMYWSVAGIGVAYAQMVRRSRA